MLGNSVNLAHAFRRAQPSDAASEGGTTSVMRRAAAGVVGPILRALSSEGFGKLKQQVAPKLFSEERSALRHAKAPDMRSERRIRRVAVVGWDAALANWATFYLNRGLDVVAVDPTSRNNEELCRYLGSAMRDVLQLDVPAGVTRGTLRFVSKLDDALARSDFVQECGHDRTNDNGGLLQEIDKRTRPDSIIATASSRDSINAVQASCRFPERWVIARSLDQPHVSPFVYIISAPGTSTTTIRQAMAFYCSVGKLPTYLRKEMGEECTQSLLTLFRQEIQCLRDENLVEERDSRDFADWGSHLCGSLLVTAMQAIPSPAFHKSGGRSLDSSECASRLVPTPEHPLR